MIVIKCLHSEWKRKKNRLIATELSEVCGIPSTIPPSTFLIKINFLFRLIHDSEKPRFKTFWHIPSHRLCSTVDELGFLVIKKHWACLCSLVSSLTYRRLHPVCWSFDQLFSNNLVKWISATKVKSPKKSNPAPRKIYWKCEQNITISHSLWQLPKAEQTQYPALIYSKVNTLFSLILYINNSK